MKTIIIDEEFKSLLPALNKETYELLEENLIMNGCRDSLKLWEGNLIDGYNRYKICMEHNIPFETEDLEFGTRDEVLIWIISNQVSRRNLNPMQLSHYRGLHYRADKRIVTNASGNNQYKVDGRHNDDKPKVARTVTRLSSKYLVSPKTIERDAKISIALDEIGEVSPEAKRMILDREVSIDKKILEQLSLKPKEEIKAVATEIEEGSYKKNAPKKETPAQSMPESPASPVLSEMRRLEATIGDTLKTVYSSVGQLSKNDLTEVRETIRSCIVALEELYRKIDGR